MAPEPKYRIFIRDVLKCDTLPDHEYPWEEAPISKAFDGFETLDEALVCASQTMYEDYPGNTLYRIVSLRNIKGEVIQEDTNHPTRKYE